MGDFYGGIHDASFSIAGQLGRHNFDMNEARLQDYDTKTILYNQLNNDEKQKVSDDEQKKAEADVVKVPAFFQTGKAITGAVKAGAEAGAATALARGGLSTSEAVGAAISGGESAILGSGRIGAAVGEAAKTFEGAAQIARSAGSAALESLATSQAAQGTKLFATKLFGAEGVTPLKELGGFEGIAARTFAGEAAGAGAEVFGKIAGKALGQVGTGIAAYQDFDNLFQTGNIFNSKNADGTIQKQTLGEDVGNIGTLLGGALDVAAAFTGGALAPLAIAVNVAAATESTVATLDADKAQEKTDEANPPPNKPPAQIAPPAFGQLGLLANQSHNPLNYIG